MSYSLLGPSCAALLMGAASTPSVVHRGTTLHALRMQMSATSGRTGEQTMTGAGRVLPAAKWQLKDKIALVGTLPPEASGNSVAEASQYLGVYTRGQLKFFAQVKGNPYSNHGYYEQLRDPNKMIWWDGETWVVGDKIGMKGGDRNGYKEPVARRIGVVYVDGQGEGVPTSSFPPAPTPTPSCLASRTPARVCTCPPSTRRRWPPRRSQSPHRSPHRSPCPTWTTMRWSPSLTKLWRGGHRRRQRLLRSNLLSLSRLRHPLARQSSAVQGRTRPRRPHKNALAKSARATLPRPRPHLVRRRRRHHLCHHPRRRQCRRRRWYSRRLRWTATSWRSAWRRQRQTQ